MIETCRMKRFACAVAALVATSAIAVPAAAQTNVTLSAGTALYSSDEFCLDSGALVTSYRAGVEGSLIGAEAMYDTDWPWPPDGSGTGGGPGGGGAQPEDRFLNHGDAFGGLVKVYPLAALSRAGEGAGLRNVDRYLRPFLGVGLLRSTDGDSAPPDAQGLPTYGVRGQTNPLVTFGASLQLPARDLPFGVFVEYRYNLLFSGDFDIDTGAAQDLTLDSETLDWGAFSVGVRYRLGQ